MLLKLFTIHQIISYEEKTSVSAETLAMGFLFCTDVYSVSNPFSDLI